MTSDADWKHMNDITAENKSFTLEIINGAKQSAHFSTAWFPIFLQPEKTHTHLWVLEEFSWTSILSVPT